jgi:hypothetical protein
MSAQIFNFRKAKGSESFNDIQVGRIGNIANVNSLGELYPILGGRHVYLAFTVWESFPE